MSEPLDSGAKRVNEAESLWPTRTVALVVAVLIWLFASYLPRLDDIEDTVVTATLSYAAPPEGMIADAERRTTVTIRIRGTADAIAPIANDSINITVPLPEPILAGVQTDVQLSAEDAALPDGVEIMSFTPSTVSVLIDELVSESVLVVPHWVGEPGAGLTRADLDFEISPERVTLTGPKAAVENFTSLATDPIDVAGRAINFEKKVGLQLSDPALSTNPTSVTVKVKLEPEPELVPAEEDAESVDNGTDSRQP